MLALLDEGDGADLGVADTVAAAEMFASAFLGVPGRDSSRKLLRARVILGSGINIGDISLAFAFRGLDWDGVSATASSPTVVVDILFKELLDGFERSLDQNAHVEVFGVVCEASGVCDNGVTEFELFCEWSACFGGTSRLIEDSVLGTARG